MITFIGEEIKTQNNPMHCLNPYQKVKMNSNPVNVIPQSFSVPRSAWFLHATYVTCDVFVRVVMWHMKICRQKGTAHTMAVS